MKSASLIVETAVPTEPPQGQRCRGRNYDGRRCCTPDAPCGLGEGDCDGPLDGGQNDGHEGCQGELVCGSNNCRKFGLYYHPKDDCCDRPQSLATERPPPLIIPGVPLEPPLNQRCRGRNYDGRRCCTPENPCDEGEGDCDGPLDGGLNDGHAGCKGNLVCGSNNCQRFGAYYHEKDDCCERPASSDCTTDSGFYPNVGCVFPFVYKGVLHSECTWEDAQYRHNRPWCATSVSAGSQYVARQWGNCGLGCPVEETSRPSTELSQVWGGWSVFSPCSRECGGGQTLRYRECQLRDMSLCPHLNQTQIRSCNFNLC